MKILSGSSHILWVQGSIYSGVRKECEELVFPKQDGLATGLSRELTAWPAWDFCPVVQQLA